MFSRPNNPGAVGDGEGAVVEDAFEFRVFGGGEKDFRVRCDDVVLARLFEKIESDFGCFFESDIVEFYAKYFYHVFWHR